MEGVSPGGNVIQARCERTKEFAVILQLNRPSRDFRIHLNNLQKKKEIQAPRPINKAAELA